MHQHVRKFSWTPADFGVDTANAADLTGGDRAANRKIAVAVLQGERGPRRDIVLVNAAAALLAAEVPPMSAKPCVAPRINRYGRSLGKSREIGRILPLQFSALQHVIGELAQVVDQRDPEDLPETLPVGSRR